MYKKLIFLSIICSTSAQFAGEIYTSPFQLVATQNRAQVTPVKPKPVAKPQQKQEQQPQQQSQQPEKFEDDDALAAHALTTLAKIMTECVKAAQNDDNPTAVLQAFGTAVAGVFDIVATALRSGRLSPHADEEEIVKYLETLGTDFHGKLKKMLLDQGDVIRALLKN